MKKSRFIPAIAILCFGIGFIGWHMGRVKAIPEVPKTTRAPAEARRPGSPAPALAPLPPTSAELPKVVEKVEGPLARLFKDPGRSMKLSPAQLANYLAANKRNAESLLAALRLTDDIAFLREAAQNFPGDASVQLELSFRSGDAGERRRAIDGLRQSDPDNALGDYLSALEHLRSGDSEQAFTDLAEASGKRGFDDYATAAVQSAEEGYMAAGFTPVEAKAAAMVSLQRRQIEPLRDLSKQLGALQKAYAAAGDAASAVAVRQMGHALGQQMQGSAQYFIDELVGMSIEKQFLDPASASARRAQLKQRTDYIRQLADSPELQRLLEGQSSTDAISYFDRQKLYGEEAAIRWLEGRR